MAPALAAIVRQQEAGTECGHAPAGWTGGGFPVAPQAALDDGLLDVMIVRDAGLFQSGEVLRELKDMGAMDRKYVFYRQSSSFRLEFDEEIRLDADGEPIYGRAFDFNILPRRLQVVLPRGTSLSRQ